MGGALVGPLLLLAPPEPLAPQLLLQRNLPQTLRDLSHILGRHAFLTPRPPLSMLLMLLVFALWVQAKDHK
jgi:hypothetical protein